MSIEKLNSFYVTTAPIRLTEGRRLKLHSKGWGLLTDYFLESVKVNHQKKGKVSSVATLRIGDRSGQITCVVRGPLIGLLFGLSKEEWMEVEKLCSYKNQLFYRYFKKGLDKSLPYEQKLFYNFCAMNKKNEVLVAKFYRCVNLRNKYKNEAFLDIEELEKCDVLLMDLYITELKRQYLL